MQTTDTIGRVPRPRGVLSEEQIATTEFLKQEAESARDDYQYWVVGLLLGGCSFTEVSSATGLSKDTLQRWKRKARK